MADTLIICIGNGLAADDGAGLAVYNELTHFRTTDNGSVVRIKYLGLGGIDLLEELSGERQLIVVDAVQLGSPPGVVHVLGWDELPEQQIRPVSGHGIGVREAIEVGKKLYPEKMPQLITLVGIEGECFDQLKEELSPSVQQGVVHAVEKIKSMLA